MDKTKLGSLLAAASAVSFGTMAIFAEIAYGQGVSRFYFACRQVYPGLPRSLGYNFSF
ncbi:MAG: hypothetical protein ACYC0Q_08080 [Eubacteriales bacterium]